MKYLAAVFTLALTACGVLPPLNGCAPTDSDKAAWSEARKLKTADGYRSYLTDYPNGCYARAANNRLRRAVAAVALPGVASNRTGGAGSGAY